MTKIDCRLFPDRRSSWTSANAKNYNALIERIREAAEKKFETPKWSTTVEYVNRFAQDGYAQYPKITPNAWKAHLRIEMDLDIHLFPAMFVHTYPTKDAGEISWSMYDYSKREWGSSSSIREIIKKSNELFVTEYRNIDAQLRIV